MVHVVFEYKDKLSNYEWRRQECVCESVDACKKFYGLGEDPDCEYRIVLVEDSSGSL